MKQESFDPGLTTQFSGELRRTINRDGSFNVRRKGRRLRDTNVYLKLIDTTWPRFLLLILAFLAVVNTLFATAYLLVGSEHLQGSQPEMSAFLNAFYFSVHTLTTVGYGDVYPRGDCGQCRCGCGSHRGLDDFCSQSPASCTGAFPDRRRRSCSAIALSSRRIRTAPVCNFASPTRAATC